MVHRHKWWKRDIPHDLVESLQTSEPLDEIVACHLRAMMSEWTSMAAAEADGGQPREVIKFQAAQVFLVDLGNTLYGELLSLFNHAPPKIDVQCTVHYYTEHIHGLNYHPYTNQVWHRADEIKH